MLIECDRIYPRVWRALLGPSGPLEGAKQGGERRDPSGRLDRKLCQVVGLNQNYVSASGTLYHVQIEDLGPVVDRVSEAEVRRVNVIVYSNYGEPNARIVHGHDHDFEDIRTHEHNLAIKRVIQDLAVDARRIVEEKEQREVMRIKAALREYYLTRNEEAKREFETANALYPFLFSRAWRELKSERERGLPGAAAAAPGATAAPGAGLLDMVYPLDNEPRERVLEIERIIVELERDLRRLVEAGGADDILVQTCRKLVARARDGLSGGAPLEFSARRLEMTRNSLATTWRQVRSRLRG